MESPPSCQDSSSVFCASFAQKEHDDEVFWIQAAIDSLHSTHVKLDSILSNISSGIIKGNGFLIQESTSMDVSEASTVSPSTSLQSAIPALSNYVEVSNTVSEQHHSEDVSFSRVANILDKLLQDAQCAISSSEHNDNDPVTRPPSPSPSIESDSFSLSETLVVSPMIPTENRKSHSFEYDDVIQQYEPASWKMVLANLPNSKIHIYASMTTIDVLNMILSLHFSFILMVISGLGNLFGGISYDEIGTSRTTYVASTSKLDSLQGLDESRRRHSTCATISKDPNGTNPSYMNSIHGSLEEVIDDEIFDSQSMLNLDPLVADDVLRDAQMSRFGCRDKIKRRRFSF